MANMAVPNGMGGGTISVRMALRLAWVTWVTLLVIPFFVFLTVVWTLMNHETVAMRSGAQPWFLAACGYMIVVVPAAFFWRDRLFKPYWSGQVIEPVKYLYGMLVMWMALEVGGIISLIGCLTEHSLLPNLLPALMAFVFFLRLWPSGRAMVRTVGHSEDASVYEEPG